MPVGTAIEKRRSKRRFSQKPLSIKEVSTLLYAAQGITNRGLGFRTAPSAGASYPLHIILFDKNGIFSYLPESHSLSTISSEDKRYELSEAALGQRCVADAPVVFLICADYRKITRRYPEKGKFYTHLEAGHSAQNILLQAVSLGIGAVPVGAFSESAVKNLSGIEDELTPLYLIPAGK
ncbi:MAG: SagB/ThcOx family dehydrogenase [Fibrobacterota bacterium]